MSNLTEENNNPLHMNSEDGAYAQLYNGSTSSSEAGSSKSTTPRIFQTIHVDVYENQHWFPIVGWATSQLAADAPNFSSAMHRYETQKKFKFSPSVADFHQAFRAKNKNTMGRGANTPVKPLQLELPSGYRWSRYWEVKFRHPKGVDPDGWRYAPFFEFPDHSPAFFKKTRTPNCMVRRRTWTRAVKLASDETSSEASPLSVSRHNDEATVELYLKEKQDEMIFAEGLKRDRQKALKCGKEWSREEELAAEEKLRSFIRISRSQLKKDAYFRLRSTSLDNPFQPISVYLETQPDESIGGIALRNQSPDVSGVCCENDIAAPTDEIGTRQILCEPSNLRPDGADIPSSILSFRHDASALGGDQGEGGKQFPDSKTPREIPAGEVSAFVQASPTMEDPQTFSSPHVIEEGIEDFDHVFSKFANNPENKC